MLFIVIEAARPSKVVLASVTPGADDKSEPARAPPPAVAPPTPPPAVATPETPPALTVVTPPIEDGLMFPCVRLVVCG